MFIELFVCLVKVILIQFMLTIVKNIWTEFLIFCVVIYNS